MGVVPGGMQIKARAAGDAGRAPERASTAGGEPADPASFARRLREALEKLITEQADIERVIVDAGLRRERIDVKGAPQRVWFSVIEEARKASRLGELLRTALAEYPDNSALDELVAAFRGSPPDEPVAQATPDEAGTLVAALQSIRDHQFEELLFRLAVPASALPPPSPRAQRVEALVRMIESQGRTGVLLAALVRVGGFTR